MIPDKPGMVNTNAETLALAGLQVMAGERR
jgi:hypothetical protein